MPATFFQQGGEREHAQVLPDVDQALACLRLRATGELRLAVQAHPLGIAVVPEV